MEIIVWDVERQQQFNRVSTPISVVFHKHLNNSRKAIWELQRISQYTPNEELLMDIIEESIAYLKNFPRKLLNVTSFVDQCYKNRNNF